MKKEAGFFVVIVLVVAATAGGVIYKAKSKSNPNNTATAGSNSTVATEDPGTVKGATTEDNGGESALYIEKLAKALNQMGAVMYGAYWCPHCKDQKALFGDALKYVNYVECDPAGENANPDECKAKGIDGYPTWIYQGQKYSGTQSLSKLAEIIGFTYTDGVDSTGTSTTAPATTVPAQP